MRRRPPGALFVTVGFRVFGPGDRGVAAPADIVTLRNGGGELLADLGVWGS